MVKIVLKWNKEKFEDVELDTTGSVEDFKATCMSLTVSIYLYLTFLSFDIRDFTYVYVY